VTFTISVRNPHSSSIPDVVVRDSVPSVFEITNVSTTQGTVEVNGQSVRAVIGTIDPGAVVEITISTVVRLDTPPGQYDNVAILTSDTPMDTPSDDPGGEPEDNSSTTTVTITDAPPRQLPTTGGITAWTWQLLLVALVALFGGAAFLVRSRSKA